MSNFAIFLSVLALTPIVDTYHHYHHRYRRPRRPQIFTCSKGYQNQKYCEYHVGSRRTKIVVIAPHGGSLKPPSITSLRAGCYINRKCVYSHTCRTPDSKRCKASIFKDVYTKELAKGLVTKLHRLTGQRPHLIINNIHRSKMDGNREINESTFGHPEAVTAHNQFHSFIRRAMKKIKGRGLVIDMHGQTHSHGKNELGYLVSKTRLINDKPLAKFSSIRHLALTVCIPFDELLRGKRSLGQLLEEQGYPTYPSNVNKKPKSNEKYFSGGYNTREYGSRYSGKIDSVQVETHKQYRNSIKGPAYAIALAKAVDKFMQYHY